MKSCFKCPGIVREIIHIFIYILSRIKLTIIHDDHEIRAPIKAILIAVLPVSFAPSLTPPKIYIRAHNNITPKLIYPTNERRVLAMLIIIHGISLNEIFPVRICHCEIQPLHSRIDHDCAKLNRVARRKKRIIIRIKVI